jgi:hypothetical protein
VCIYYHAFCLPFFRPPFVPAYSSYLFSPISLAFTYSRTFLQHRRTQFGLHNTDSEGNRRVFVVFVVVVVVIAAAADDDDDVLLIHFPVLPNFTFISRHNSTDTNS